MDLFTIENLKQKTVGVATLVKKLVMDDPRRVIHCLKVGLALTFVSILYYVNPLYNGLGVSTMWAVITVVVIMEYSVGGTLGKGLNRAFATFVAGVLGLGAHYLAALSGAKGEPVVLGCFVFFLAAAATFSRFIPEIKANYDHGVLVFILTFSLVAISSYRVAEIINLAQQRASSVAIGGALCIIISVCLYPVWAGGDLHDLTALNLESLALYLEGLAREYFTEKGVGGIATENSYPQAYKRVLNSKATEESLVNLASWEPGHGCFSFRHPWRQYLKVGACARRCACYIEALNAQVIKYEFEASSESQRRIREVCRAMCSESNNALKALAMSIRTMTTPSDAEIHIKEASNMVDVLKTILLEEDTLSDVIHAATIASILIEVVMCTENIAKSTRELASSAKFNKNIKKPVSDTEESNHVCITLQK